MDITFIRNYRNIHFEKFSFTEPTAIDVYLKRLVWQTNPINCMSVEGGSSKLAGASRCNEECWHSYMFSLESVSGVTLGAHQEISDDHLKPLLV